MDGRIVHGRRLRALREQAGLRLPELARSVGCSVGHLKNIETADTLATRAHHQPSGALAYRLLHELSRHLNRPVGIDEIATADQGRDGGVAA